LLHSALEKIGARTVA